MSPLPLGILSSSMSLPPINVEYLIVNGGGSTSGLNGGGGGYFKTGSISLASGTSQTVVVGAAGNNSSLTSVSAPTNYNGLFRYPASTQSTGIGYLPDGCTYIGANISAGGGGAGATSDGLNGSINQSGNSLYWRGGDGGGQMSTWTYVHSGGGGGSVAPFSVFGYNYCFDYGLYYSGYAGNGWSNYGSGGTNGSGYAGVVVIRYLDTLPDLSSSTGAKTVSGGYKYYTFTSTGSFTV